MIAVLVGVLVLALFVAVSAYLDARHADPDHPYGQGEK